MKNEDPILASVTVPLSSGQIYIEEEEDDNQHSNNDSLSGAASADRESKKKKKKEKKNGTYKRRTKITIPLHMSCSHAPNGSISLKITMKIPCSHIKDKGDSEGDGIANDNDAISSLVPLVPSMRISSSSDTNGDSKVSESIELGLFTRLMDGWTLGVGSATTNVGMQDAGCSERSQATAAVVSSDREVAGSCVSTTKNLSQRKRFKKLLSLKSSKTTTTALDDVGDDTTVSLLQSNASQPISSRSQNSTSGKKNEEGGTISHEGWFSFLNS